MSKPTTDAKELEKGKRLALVIGVNHAPNSYLPELKHADADAQEMAVVLQQYCRFEILVPPLVGENATSEQVQHAVYKFAQHRTDGDFLLLYFSGHGQPILTRGNDYDIYLVTYDFREREVEQKKGTHISMPWLRDTLYIPLMQAECSSFLIAVMPETLADSGLTYP